MYEFSVQKFDVQVREAMGAVGLVTVKCGSVVRMVDALESGMEGSGCDLAREKLQPDMGTVGNADRAKTPVVGGGFGSGYRLQQAKERSLSSLFW